jgi:hypothetical protein
VLANAGSGAPWRTAFQIAEPSRQLCDAVSFISLAVRAVTPPRGVPMFDELVNSCREDRADAPRLETLARRVLRSTLDQLRSRQVHVKEEPGPEFSLTHRRVGMNRRDAADVDREPP